MDAKLFSAVLDIAEQMIEVGAEIHRVEDSIRRVCKAYGVKRVDVYATTSNVILSVEDETLTTHTRRIRQTGTDIEKLDQLNTLVRDMTERTPTAEDKQARLAAIRRTSGYPTAVTVLMYGVIAASFCLFFGGRNLAEISAAAIIGLLVGLTSKGVEHFTLNKLLSRFLCSFLACGGAFLCLRFGWIPKVDNVIIGNIMSLIPGIGLTNSLRDLFTGDSITGILRSIEAVLLALAIAGGYLLAAFLAGGAL